MRSEFVKILLKTLDLAGGSLCVSGGRLSRFLGHSFRLLVSNLLHSNDVFPSAVSYTWHRI